MIKTAGSQAGRIAQACDRCRSKKIRCDGLRPHCSQCMSVGFECKISDKLSRRAYPRGYTESLEDRIRQLEQDNNKMMNLLDIKDEQLELLSRVETTLNSRHPADVTRVKPEHETRKETDTAENPPAATEQEDEDQEYYVVKQINTLGVDGSYTGSSSGGCMIKTLIEKFQDKGMEHKLIESLSRISNSINDMHPLSADCMVFPVTPCGDGNTPGSWTVPYTISKISMDHLTTIYFQEWHSMYPILDQSSFFSSCDLEVLHSGTSIERVILYLVLSLASLATRDTKSKEGNGLEAWRLRNEWKQIFTPALQSAPSLSSAQALALALLYSLHTGNVDDMWHYRVMAVNMSQRLGLHRCHKSLRTREGKALSVKEQEIRRRIFWSINSLDCFAAATLGAPKLIREQDIECAMPANDDDPVTNIDAISPADTQKALSTSSSNGDVKIESCSLAVIKFAQILASILDTVYSCTTPNHSYKTVVQLEDQLESWRRELAPSLKFDLQNGKPTATLLPLHQKSPILLMLYHSARITLHMPAITGPAAAKRDLIKSSGSNVALTQSAKTYLQVYNYLNARHVTATIPMPLSRMCALYGGIIMYGALDYSKCGSLMQEVRSILNGSLKQLEIDSDVCWPGALTSECYELLHDICCTVIPGGTRRKSSMSESLVSTKDTPIEKESSLSTVNVPSSVKKESIELNISSSIIMPATDSKATRPKPMSGAKAYGDELSALEALENDPEKAVQELLQLNGLWKSSREFSNRRASEPVHCINIPNTPPMRNVPDIASESLPFNNYDPLGCSLDLFDNDWLNDYIKR